MGTASDLGSMLLGMVEQSPDCDVDELVAHCSEATWNQILMTMDRLSRSGRLTLRQLEPGRYKASLAPQKPDKIEASSYHYA